MSDVTVTFIRAHGRSQDGTNMPTLDLSDPSLVSQVLISSAASGATAVGSPHRQGEGFVDIFNNGSDTIAVKAGTSPTAVAATCIKVAPGQMRQFAINAGHKVAVINA